MENFKLADFFVNEDYTKDVNVTNDTSMYDPLNEDGENQDGTLKYKTKIDGRSYKISFDVNKNPTKKGIKVKFFPLDENGNEKRALLYNIDDTKTNVIWDKTAKCFRFYAVYAETPVVPPTP